MRPSMPRRLTAPARGAVACALVLAAGLALWAGAATAARQGHAPAPQQTTVGGLDRDAALAASQDAIGRRMGDYAFTDTAGRTVRLSDFRGEPVVISLVYSSCNHTCPLITQRLADVVPVARDALGEDSFSVLTIGFDTRRDSPARMQAFAREQGVDTAGWRFLSAERETIEKLTRDLGFVFVPSPAGFDHLAQVTVVDQDGAVAAQVYGSSFEAPLLVEPLKSLVFGTATPFASVDDLVKRVRLFCTIYDPASDSYRFDYSIFIGMAIGTVSLGGVAFFLVRGWLRTRPNRRTAG